jgi:hypothetical protein
MCRYTVQATKKFAPQCTLGRHHVCNLYATEICIRLCNVHRMNSHNFAFLTCLFFSIRHVLTYFLCSLFRKYIAWLLHGCSSQYSDLLRTGRSGDRIPVEAKFSAPVHIDPAAHPDFSTMCTVLFLGVKRLERDDDHSPPSSARLRIRWNYVYFHLPFVPA